MTPTEKAEEKAHKVLQEATDRALDLISNSEKKARQNIASEAADAKKVVNVNGANDHDLLIAMETKLTRVLEDLQEIKGNNEKRILSLEDRTRSIENKFSGIWITLSIYSLAIVGLFGVIMNHLSK